MIAGVQTYQQTGDPWKTAGAFGIGFVAGGAATIVAGQTVVTVAMGAAAGSLGNLASQVFIAGRGWNEIDWGSAAISAVAGGAGGYAAKRASGWINTSASRVATWLRTNTLRFDDEVIEAGVSGGVAGTVDWFGQAAWAQIPRAGKSSSNSGGGSDAPVMPQKSQPSK